MDKPRYVVRPEMEAVDKGWPHPWLDKGDESWEENNGIWELDYRGVPVRFISNDAMEPEDATFNRSLSWIVKELNKAYQNGYSSGFEDGSYDALSEGYHQGWDNGYRAGREEF